MHWMESYITRAFICYVYYLCLLLGYRGCFFFWIKIYNSMNACAMYIEALRERVIGSTAGKSCMFTVSIGFLLLMFACLWLKKKNKNNFLQNGVVECRRIFCPPANCSKDSLPVHVDGTCCKKCRRKYQLRRFRSSRKTRNVHNQTCENPLCASTNISFTPHKLAQVKLTVDMAGHFFCQAV